MSKRGGVCISKANRLLCFLVLIQCFFIEVNAQKKITVEKAIMGRYSEFARKTYTSGSFKPGSEVYTYVKNPDSIMLVTAGKESEKLFLSRKEINNAIQDKNNSFEFSGIVRWLDDKNILLNAEQRYLIYNTSKKSVVSSVVLPNKALNVDISETGRSMAYTLDNNLFVYANDKHQQISNESDKGIVSGQIVSRNEFGISKGTFWSPKGNLLAFYRKDEREVNQYPLISITEIPATVDNIRYPMAGGKSEKLSLGIYSLATGKTVFVEAGDTTNHYLTCVSWSPDERYLFIAVLNRAQNQLKLNRYNAQTGAFEKTIFEETHPKYVEPEKALVFLPKSNTEFLWYSARSGYKHWYRYSVDGAFLGAATKGDFEVYDIEGFDKTNSTLYCNSTILSPLDVTPTAFTLADGSSNALTQDAGIHFFNMSDDGKVMFDIFETPNMPRQAGFVSSTGKVLKTVYTCPNLLKDYELGHTEMLTLTSSDGKTPLYARMVTPAKMEAGRKYPVIVYVYGGPHNQLVSHSWLNEAPLWDHCMAAKGYIVFTLDNRGSEHRGLDFENVVHRQLGVCEMDDQMTGIRYLKSLAYVDSTRLGVFGWSFGGFMSLNLMTEHAETFKVGVAGGPVTDWNLYEVMYGERYMDTPLENPTGYANSCVLNKIDKLKGSVLVIHGGIDPTVVPQQSFRFLEQSIKHNKQVDFFLYPTHEHNVRGKDRVHLYEKITRYFEEKL